MEERDYARELPPCGYVSQHVGLLSFLGSVPIAFNSREQSRVIDAMGLPRKGNPRVWV